MARSVARAAVRGAQREDWMREAIHVLAESGGADRIGVWLETVPGANSDPSKLGCFRGIVWEQGNEVTPAEWESLSLEAPLPQDLLRKGTSVEQDLNGSAEQPPIGPLVGLHRALWIPVERAGHVRGVLLAGTRAKHANLPRELFESVAAELALALEWEEGQQNAKEKNADLALSQRVLEALANGTPCDEILTALAQSCTSPTGDAQGPGATFAAIGWRGSGSPLNWPTKECEFAWTGGDAEWVRAIQNEPFDQLWKRAMGTGKLIGSEPKRPKPERGVARIVAVPLVAAGEPLGVLVAGLAPARTSLGTLERLELRASLAAAVLARRKKEIEEARRTAWRRVFLTSSRDASVLVDACGSIAGLNRGARLLLGEAERVLPDSQKVPAAGACASRQLEELFRTKEHDRVREWMRETFSGEANNRKRLPEPFEAELFNGVRVRLRAVPAADDLAAVLFEPVPSGETRPEQSRAELELHNVLEWVEEGVVLFGASDEVRALNIRFAQIIGLAPNELPHCTTLGELISRLADKAAEPDDFARRWRELAAKTESATREELRLARPVPRVIERASRPILDAAGRRVGRVEIYRDLTAQRVFQSKLLQTEKLAALGQMMTSVAHELSNPLTTILGYAQRLLLRDDSPGRTDEARQIYQEAERAGTILRQLLLTARETPPEKLLVMLNQVVQRAFDLQRFGLASEKIHVEMELDPTLPFVLGDPGKLQQVLMNLIGNARQAIEQQGKGGAIRLRTAQTNAGRVLLEVSDDGPGIPKAILARIFDPFFTTKAAGVGTGLGLAIVQSVVREHGGSISVSSPPGRGAVFSLEFPAAAEPATEIARESVAAGGESVPLSGLEPSSAPQELAGSNLRAAKRQEYKGYRVLVVEDEPTVAQLIADVLDEEGFEVDVLLDGREALNRAVRQPYDLMICDMKMPGLDGQHLYKSLVQAGNPLQERFLFVTGDVIAPHTRRFLEQNRIPYVAKPFRMEELTEKVYRVLESRSARVRRAAVAKKKQ